MRRSWNEIVAIFRQKRRLGDDAFQAAIGGVEEVAILIAEGPLQSVLFGWTSMHDLCIQQTDVPPGAGPYLRVAPPLSGAAEFRHVDTAISERQWSRVVSPDQAAARFVRLLDQLHWVSPPPAPFANSELGRCPSRG